MPILRCKVKQVGSIRLWIPFAQEDNQSATLLANQDAVFMVDGEIKADLRKSPPFIQILPCPYCGAEEDRNHVAKDHVDSRLGNPIH